MNEWWVMQVLGIGSEQLERPMYVVKADIDGEDDGQLQMTADISKAKHFDTGKDVTRYWKRRSKVIPDRPDGEPNRPLTVLGARAIKVIDGECEHKWTLIDGIAGCKECFMLKEAHDAVQKADKSKLILP